MRVNGAMTGQFTPSDNIWSGRHIRLLGINEFDCCFKRPNKDYDFHGIHQDKFDLRNDSLKSLFYPESVAVIGASSVHGKPGNIILRNLMRSGTKVRLYPVNASHSEVEGLNAYPSVLLLPETPDLAIVSVSTQSVLDVTAECVFAGVKNIVVVSSGFSELGTSAGMMIEDRIRELIGAQSGYDAIIGTDTKRINAHGVMTLNPKKDCEVKGVTRVIGPNTLGLLVPHTGIDATFLDSDEFVRPPPGKIAVVSQSGSLAVEMMQDIAAYGAGLSVFIGLGNKVDVDECDIIDYLSTEPFTKAIALYIEGIKDGASFYRSCREVSGKKPIVVLKGGRTEYGQNAGKLHTGSCGANYKVFHGAMRQAGVVIAENDRELLDYARALSELPPPSGNRLIIITNGGGYGVMAADAIGSLDCAGLSLSAPPADLRTRLSDILPGYLAPGNPLDLGSQAVNKDFISALDLAISSSCYDLAVLCITAKNGIDDNLAAEVQKLVSRIKFPVIACIKGKCNAVKMMQEFGRHGIPSYPDADRALKSLASYIEWHRSPKRVVFRNEK